MTVADPQFPVSPALAGATHGNRDVTYELRLYVAGHSPKGVMAIENLMRVCEMYIPAGKYHIKVIDLLEHPQLARGDEIIAVPTLVRSLPEPIARIVGDLSDTNELLVGLQLRPRPNA